MTHIYRVYTRYIPDFSFERQSAGVTGYIGTRVKTFLTVSSGVNGPRGAPIRGGFIFWAMNGFSI